MNHLEKILGNQAKSVRWPDDVAMLKSKIPELQVLSDGMLELVYSDWSENYYAASWLILDDASIQEFRQYMLGENKDE